MRDELHFTENCSILFMELLLLERSGAARRPGFDAVGSAGTTSTEPNSYGGDMAAGDRGPISTPGPSELVAGNAELCFDIGTRLGCRSFNALYGNRRPGSSPKEQDECATENLGAVAVSAVANGEADLDQPALLRGVRRLAGGGHAAD